MRGRRTKTALAWLATAAMLGVAAAAAAQSGSTSTTTTTFIPPTTTIDPGVDVTGGGRYVGGFQTNQYDLFQFDLASPAVLVAETSNGIGFCSGDTLMRLERDGVVLATDDDSGPGQCSRVAVRLEEPGSYEILVAGYQGQAVREYWLTVEFVETTCGNDVLELLEECDDGNVADGDCCTSSCTSVADGSACDNGRACDGADSCLDGACAGHSLQPCPGADGDEDCSESCSDSAPGCTFPDDPSSACNDGLFCNGADRCDEGLCVLHAGDPCPGPDGDHDCDERCSEAADACALPDPDGIACDDAKFCNGADKCLAGECKVHEGSPCTGVDGDSDCSESCSEDRNDCSRNDPLGSACDDGLFCNGTDACSAGVCSIHVNAPCPGPDGDGNCAESCNEGTDSCGAADAAGSPCNDGVFCNGADFCLNGTCSVHAGNPCAGADGDGNCAESCNETSDTCTAADPNGSPCNDAVFCNGADTCQAGQCGNHAGNPCPGADGDSNCAESCDEASDTCSAADPNGSACNDAVFCNGADTCAGGLCSAHAGSPCAGTDGDANCAESCNEAADACTAADPDGSPCNDGLFCNGADSCSAGACSAHAAGPCAGADGDANCAESCNEAADACTAADPDGSACNDGVFCNGADTCAGGVCSAHAGNPCPGADGDANCAESCNEATDACTTADPNGSVCNDGLFCNGADSCQAGQCSTHAGNPCPGADGDGNCTESCNETADACTAADPNGSACNDGLFCNGADTCQAGQCSTHAGNPCPGADGDGNCSESCNEAGDTCTAADGNGAPCNDGVFCNGADTCQAGQCATHAGNPCQGADGDGNCAESCNETSDACTAADPNGSACNDGLACNGTDTCQAGGCTGHSGNPCPGADGDGNCMESCSDSASGCSGADPEGTPCDDGIFCNGADRCSGGTCSVHLGSPCAGADADADCNESCDEAGKTCTAYDGSGAACSDGLFCNGADTCSGGQCSVHAGNPCPGADGDANCAESCSEASDACNAPDANGSACNDGLFCNGADTCAAGACSGHAGNPCPGADGDSHCSESCSETTDACNAADPDGSTCDDGLFCNGADACFAGACSQHDGDPCAGADGDANCSESCSEQGESCAAADPDDSACDDGVFCNGSDRCSAGACTVHLGSPCPGPDGDANCAETCSEAANACTAADPNGSACSDGAYCNGSDTCLAGACSQHAGDPCSGGDGDADCAESCDESVDGCTANDPAGSACSDADRCTIDDACDGSGACGSDSVVRCDDGDDCTQDACNASGVLCSYTPIPNCPSLTTTTTLASLACGDANGNGSLTAADALAVLRSAVGGTQCDGIACVCDVNGAGGVTAADALLVLRRAVGLAIELLCAC